MKQCTEQWKAVSFCVVGQQAQQQEVALQQPALLPETSGSHHPFWQAGVLNLSTSSITEDINFNIRLNRTAIVLITAGHIIFINKIMQNSIDFLSHTLFRREHKRGQCNAGSLM